MSDNHQDISYIQNFAIYMNINLSILFFLNVKKCKKTLFWKTQPTVLYYSKEYNLGNNLTFRMIDLDLHLIQDVQ